MLTRILGGVGRSMMTVGTLILLFVAYQLWGTGIQEARSQKQLSAQFDEMLADATAAGQPAASTTAPAAATASAASLPVPSYGGAVARIKIPKIGITRTVVSGDSVDQLARGPGHVPVTPLPGQKGNSAIAGHRTTYGQPFHNIDKLEPGDKILTTTVQGDFVYVVAGTQIVKPEDVSVMEDKGDNRLTLIACHPKYSLKERIIVHAILEGAAKPEIPGQATARAKAAADRNGGKTGLDSEQATLDAGLSGRPVSKTPAILWGLACAAIWLATWLVQTLIRRRSAARAEGRPSRGQRMLSWTPYAVGLPIFLVALYFFFENFARFLPGNY